MRVKRFVAENMQEAMVKVKMDMGKEAVIIQTRKFRQGGFFGLFGRKMVEVTAAVEDQPPVAVAAEPLIPAPIPAEIVIPPQLQKLGAEQDGDDLAELQGEINEMKTLMQEVIQHIETPEAVKNMPKGIKKVHQILLDNEVEEKLAKRLTQSLTGKLPAEELEDPEKVQTVVMAAVQKLLKTPKPINFKKDMAPGRAIALVGPTGVGKTTTIAKLAATFSIVHKKKVALVTADTYRIAAVEQLKTFGEIIGVQVDVVYTPQELKTAMGKHQDMDVILIDTAGRSHKNAMQMSELKGFLDVASPNETFLVLSATTKYKDMLDIIDCYSDIAVDKLVFTKLDETSSCGSILNVVTRTKKTLSYVTNGQNVPDDIEIANPVLLAELITKER